MGLSRDSVGIKSVDCGLEIKNAGKMIRSSRWQVTRMWGRVRYLMK